MRSAALASGGSPPVPPRRRRQPRLRIAQQTASHLTLWYRRPAQQWVEALPVGNGRLGAMVFGGIERERLQLNEDTLWSGGPRDWNNPNAPKVLAEVRRLIAEEKYVEADRAARGMQGPYTQSFEPLGDLVLAFEHGDIARGGYRRAARPRSRPSPRCAIASATRTTCARSSRRTPIRRSSFGSRPTGRG